MMAGSVTSEWFWVALIFALPFLVFGLFELMGFVRRRRERGIAQRRKDVPRHVRQRTMR
jgi:hypothetical protein